MPSGHFSRCPVSDITINERQRSDLPDIPVLADSLSRLGQIHPIVLTRDLILIAGARRLAAAKSLGWTDIAFQYVDEIEPEFLAAIELEENVKRSDLSWQDRTRAIEKYHSLRKQSDPTWTERKTATALGLDFTSINKHLTVAKDMASPEVAAAPKFSVASGIVTRKNERRAQDALAGIVAQPTNARAQILHQDFFTWQYDGPPFNFLHCDFPYGINSHKSAQGAQSALGAYADTKEIYWQLMVALATFPHIAEAAHLIHWFSMDFYEPTRAFLTECGWTVDPFPLIWYKSDGTGILPDPQRGPRRIYETAFFCRRGDRKIIRAKANAFAHSSVSTIHPHQKPEPMLTYFMEMLVNEDTRCLDPTCGSGSAIRAVERLGGQAIGLERDEEFAQRAQHAQ